LIRHYFDFTRLIFLLSVDVGIVAMPHRRAGRFRTLNKPT
jgi:hypothetical protein